MTKNEVIMRAIAKEITWIQAAHICGVSDRQMRRVKRAFERRGYDGVVDHRGRTPRRQRIPLATLEQVCALKRDRYGDFSVQHFWEQLAPAHGITLSYTWTKLTLQAAGLVEKSPGRGRYRRRRARRQLRGMMVHLDASRHRWLPALPMQDLVVAMDDADGRILYARFVPEEGTASTFAALTHILTTYGRFAELSTRIGAVTSAIRPRRAARPALPTTGRSAARSKCLGSGRSWPTRPKRAAAASGPSKRFRADSPRNCASPA